jgi:surface antigen
MLRHIRILAVAGLAAVLAAPAVLADPPSHAPAHGWRAKHDPYYVGYTGRNWDHDYGISSGRCNRSEVGTVVGAVIGGAIGSTVGKGEDRLVAILIGSAIGAVVGREIGRDMDDSDRACMGHALELARNGEWVRWDGGREGRMFGLRPDSGFERDGLECRRFTLEVEDGGHSRREQGSACRVADGEWRLR